MVQNIIYEILLTALRENAQLYVDETGMKKKQKKKKEDTSMNYFPKTEYWRPLFPNDEGVDKTNNPLKNLCASSLAENESDSVLV